MPSRTRGKADAIAATHNARPSQPIMLPLDIVSVRLICPDLTDARRSRSWTRR